MESLIHLYKESLCLYLSTSHWQLHTPLNTTLKCKLLVDGGVVRFFYKIQNVLYLIKMWFKCDNVTDIIFFYYVKFVGFSFLDYIKPKILSHHLKLNLIYLENQIWVLQKNPSSFQYFYLKRRGIIFKISSYMDEN